LALEEVAAVYERAVGWLSSINASLEKYWLLPERTTAPADKVVIDRIDNRQAAD
jgi:hypothetical protein